VLERGEQVGKYIVEAHVGSGAMADVYRVRHAHLGSMHALKVLNEEYRHREEIRERFLIEGRVAAQLGHPNIVGVTDTVATNDTAGLVMELVEGPDLDVYIQGLAMNLDGDQIRGTFIPILRAVGFAHEHNIIHRDIKPENVLLVRHGTSFTPKVTDFGIAKVTDAGVKGRKRSTHVDARMGTLNYMSPEQIRRSKEVTIQSDVFSLGALLYELATRCVAFDAESDFDLMNQVVAGDYVPPEERVSGIDPLIADAIERALQTEPADRFASCSEFEQALVSRSVPALLPEDPVSDDPVKLALDPTVLDLPEAPSLRKSKNGLLLLLVGFVVVGALGAGLYVMSKGGGEEVKRGTSRPAATAPARPQAPVTSDPDASTYDVVNDVLSRHAESFGESSGGVKYLSSATVIGPGSSQIDDVPEMQRRVAAGESADAIVDELLRSVQDSGNSYWLVFDLTVGTKTVRATEVAERTADGWRVVAAHWSSPQSDKVTNSLARSEAIHHDAVVAGTESVGPLGGVYAASVANIGDSVSSKTGVLMLGSQATDRVYGGDNVEGMIATWRLRLEQRGPAVTGITRDGSIGWALGTVVALGNGWEKPYRLMLVYEKSGDDWEVVQLHFSVATR
jgi:serine/threonine protein kinase